MALSRQRQRQIMLDDAKRRNAREAADIEAIVAAHGKIREGIDPYLFSRSIRGVPSPNNRNHKASQDSWKRGLRDTTVGVASPTDTIPTVRVTKMYDSGEMRTTVVPASSFRKPRNVTKIRTVTVQAQNDCQRMADTIGYIGNVE
jgi:hypothetical protein